MLNKYKLGLTTALAVGFMSLPTYAEINTNINESVSPDQKIETETVANYDFGVYDQDDNLAVSQIEFMAGIGNATETEKELFMKYDANGDSALNQEEFEEFARKEGDALTINDVVENTKEAAEETADAVVETTEETIEAAENALTPNTSETEEKVVMTMDFEVFDTNNDDVVSASEFEAQTEAISPRMEFGSFDSDNDGELTMDEFQVYVDTEPRIEADAEDLVENTN